jgi:hypothetical protein
VSLQRKGSEPELYGLSHKVRVGQRCPFPEYRQAVVILNIQALLKDRRNYPLEVQFDGLGWTVPSQLSEDAKRWFIDEKKVPNVSVAMCARTFCNTKDEYCNAVYCQFCGRPEGDMTLFWAKCTGITIFPKLRRCRCNLTFYCCKECQNSDWSIHERSCVKK